MNYFDGKFLAVLLVLIRSTFALDKDVSHLREASTCSNSYHLFLLIYGHKL